MKRLLKVLIFLVSISGMCVSYAKDDVATLKPQSLCPVMHTLNRQQNPVYFLQHQFDSGLQELAIATLDADKNLSFKRVTYHQLKEPVCHYPALLIAEGLGWGWHIAWTDTQNLYYTRMDGEAWIAPPIKTLAEKVNPKEGLVLLQADKKMWLIWQEQHHAESKVFAVYSNDEGRFWKDAKLLTQSQNSLSEFEISIKQTIPYLVWKGESEGVSLATW
ncbi:MAG: hypothetical protein HOP21_12065 [Methylotenera sp.]|nr:hypothetical protein [Methylotenera sp.]